ncbi:MAG: isoprenylcysteine carboxylmethyltransferase family protein [Gemmatimonadaceae bacterium]
MTRQLELRVPPAAVTLIAALLMWLGAGTFSFGWSPTAARSIIALAFALVGALIIGAGIFEFRRARTTVSPMRPEGASSLIVTGIYRVSRNPMYLGFAIVLCAWAIYLSNPLSLLGVVAFVAYMNRFQIIPEETALRALFGHDFERYATQVRRWL